MRTRLGVWLALGALLISSTASAQQPAAIAGQIVDVTGAPVEGATIALTGNSLLTPRTATTNADGRYRLDLLAAGTYTITVEKTGVGRLTGTIVASNGRDTTGDFILGANITEKIAVTSSSPDVNLASTEITFSYKREFIDSLPLERSYKGLLQLTPGVAENGTFAPNGGGSRQDNTYLIDGASITNPLFGYLSTEVNELDVAEVHIKRGAVSARVWPIAGLHHERRHQIRHQSADGHYRFEAIPAAWIQESDRQVRASTDRWINAAAPAGRSSETSCFSTARAGCSRPRLPAQPTSSARCLTRKDKSHELFAKVTAMPVPAAVLNVSYRHRPSEAENADIGPEDSPAVGTNGEGINRLLRSATTGSRMRSTVISAQVVHLDENAERVALTELGFQPAFDPFGLAAMGHVRVGGLSVGGAEQRSTVRNI